VSCFVDLLLDFLVVFCPKVKERGSHDRHMIAEFDTLKSRLFSTCSGRLSTRFRLNVVFFIVIFPKLVFHLF